MDAGNSCFLLRPSRGTRDRAGAPATEPGHPRGRSATGVSSCAADRPQQVGDGSVELCCGSTAASRRRECRAVLRIDDRSECHTVACYPPVKSPSSARASANESWPSPLSHRAPTASCSVATRPEDWKTKYRATDGHPSAARRSVAEPSLVGNARLRQPGGRSSRGPVALP